MEGVKAFYRDNCGVVAVLEKGYRIYDGEAVAGCKEEPNTDWVSLIAITPDYLMDNCKLITEEQARKLHPALFRCIGTIIEDNRNGITGGFYADAN